jgi:hypothetical protein
MGVVSDIMRTYRTPRAVLRHRIGPEENERTALATIMIACFLIFIAQWPRLSREAFEAGQDLEMMVGGTLLAWIFIMPLVFYIIAGVLFAILKLARRPAVPYEVRMATFWALLAATPLWLFYGLTNGFLEAGAGTTIVGAVAFGAFAIFWVLGLIEVSSSKGTLDV